MLALPGALQRQTAGAPAVQRVKAVILEGMPDEIKKTIEFLNAMESTESYGTSFMQGALADGIKILEKSAYREHCKGLIDTIKPRLPRELFEGGEPVEMTDREIHSIWVQGDYTQDAELAEGMATREGSGAETWQNLIWVYHSLEKSNASQFGEVAGMVCKPIRIGRMDALEVDFVETIRAWPDRPEWVDRFLPLLEVLLAKKSYVTMSDIMRMIILYYRGGLYMDVKIQLSSPDARFFDTPMVNAKKLQVVDTGMQKENWAMVAAAACEMIEKIMTDTLKVFPSAEELERLPENYSHDGQYSQAHKTLHEQLGPWRQIERQGDKKETINAMNPSLKLKNPRPVNSWTHDDGFDFNWNQPSPWRAMAENIQQLPPHNNNLSPQNVLLALTRTATYDGDYPDFWAAYDRFRAANGRYRYNLSPVQVINRIRGERPTRLYIMSPDDWDTYRQFKLDHPNDFVYFD